MTDKKSTQEVLLPLEEGNLQAEIVEVQGKSGPFLKANFPFSTFTMDGEKRRSHSGTLSDCLAARKLMDEMIEFLSFNKDKIPALASASSDEVASDEAQASSKKK